MNEAELSDFPVLLKPKHIQKILGINQSEAYRLFNSTCFPAEKNGSKHFIPKPRFIKWLNEKGE
jgi:hypothetical protein